MNHLHFLQLSALVMIVRDLAEFLTYNVCPIAKLCASMVVFRATCFGRGTVRCLRTINTTNAVSKRAPRHVASRKNGKNQSEIDFDALDPVEEFSNLLINDTSRSVAENLTKDHQKIRQKIKAQIIYRKNFRCLFILN